jgi:SAM-dependent methyltransferase
MPCLEDQVGNTPFDAHYFHQGAWLARRLAAAGPALHVDVGSSVMMLSVLSAHVRLLFVDYRPLRARLPGLSCIAGSALQLPFADASLESVSSLHVIEHVGLGRYGDAVNPAGSELALAELARVMRPGGKLYLSVPVGRERTCFNAHRVFSPSTIAGCLSQLVPISFSLVDDDGAWNNEVPGSMETSLDHIEYGCGMFEFTRGHD